MSPCDCYGCSMLGQGACDVLCAECCEPMRPEDEPPHVCETCRDEREGVSS